MNDSKNTAERVDADYTACGMRLIAPGDPTPGTYQVAVYCDRHHGHDGNHHACIEWDDEPSRRIAQGQHDPPADQPWCSEHMEPFCPRHADQPAEG